MIKKVNKYKYEWKPKNSTSQTQNEKPQKLVKEFVQSFQGMDISEDQALQGYHYQHERESEWL